MPRMRNTSAVSVADTAEKELSRKGPWEKKERIGEIGEIGRSGEDKVDEWPPSKDG